MGADPPPRCACEMWTVLYVQVQVHAVVGHMRRPQTLQCVMSPRPPADTGSPASRLVWSCRLPPSLDSLLPLASVPWRRFRTDVGERGSDACAELRELAEAVTPATLRKVRAPSPAAAPPGPRSPRRREARKTCMWRTSSRSAWRFWFGPRWPPRRPPPFSPPCAVAARRRTALHFPPCSSS